MTLGKSLDQTIDGETKGISDAQYLAKVREIMVTVRDRCKSDVPPALEGNALAQAIFGAVSDKVSVASGSVLREDPVPYRVGTEATQSGLADLHAEISRRMEEIIRKHAVVRWRGDPDAQNRMRNDMDDFLFELQSRRGIALTLEQMDSLIESGIAIARNRPHDV